MAGWRWCELKAALAQEWPDRMAKPLVPVKAGQNVSSLNYESSLPATHTYPAVKGRDLCGHGGLSTVGPVRGLC